MLEHFCEQNHKLGIILVNFNGKAYNVECISSINMSSYKNLMIYVVDNNSTDNSVEELQNIYKKNITIIKNNENLGFSEANNIGIKRAIRDNCDYLLLLNNDTIIEPDMIEIMINTSLNNSNSVICPKIYYYDNRKIIWSAGGTINWNKGLAVQYGIDEKDNGQYDENKSIEFASGCCILIPKKVIDAVGYLSHEYFLYYEDTDYSIRIINEGIKIIFCPEAKMYHKVSASTGGAKSELLIYYMTRNRLIFNRKFNEKYIIAMLYFYLTFSIKATVWFIKGESYIPKTMVIAIKDFYKGKTGKKF